MESISISQYQPGIRSTRSLRLGDDVSQLRLPHHMAHAYRLPIRVWRGKGPKRLPASLQWRGERYRVLEVLTEWHLMDRWWVTPEEAFETGRGTTDRLYYRIRCQEAGTPYDMLCEIYFDQEQNVWVMDRVID